MSDKTNRLPHYYRHRITTVIRRQFQHFERNFRDKKSFIFVQNAREHSETIMAWYLWLLQFRGKTWHTRKNINQCFRWHTTVEISFIQRRQINNTYIVLEETAKRNWAACSRTIQFAPPKQAGGVHGCIAFVYRRIFSLAMSSMA